MSKVPLNIIFLILVLSSCENNTRIKKQNAKSTLCDDHKGEYSDGFVNASLNHVSIIPLPVQKDSTDEKKILFCGLEFEEKMSRTYSYAKRMALTYFNGILIERLSNGESSTYELICFKADSALYKMASKGGYINGCNFSSSDYKISKCLDSFLIKISYYEGKITLQERYRMDSTNNTKISVL